MDRSSAMSGEYSESVRANTLGEPHSGRSHGQGPWCDVGDGDGHRDPAHANLALAEVRRVALLSDDLELAEQVCTQRDGRSSEDFEPFARKILPESPRGSEAQAGPFRPRRSALAGLRRRASSPLTAGAPHMTKKPKRHGPVALGG